MFGGGSNASILLGFQYWLEPPPVVTGPRVLLPLGPLADARDVALDATVVFRVTNASVVIQASLVIIIGGEVAYQDGGVQPGWQGTVDFNEDINVSLKRNRPFAPSSHVIVDVRWETMES